MNLKTCSLTTLLLLLAATATAEPAESAEEVPIPTEQNAVTWDDLVLEQEEIMQRYVSASALIGAAQEIIATALNLKSDAVKIREESDALSENSAVDRKAVNRFVKISKRTNARIQKALSKNQELSKDNRILFTQGLVRYADAVQETRGVVAAAEPFAKSVMLKATQNANEARQQIEKRRWTDALNTFKQNETTPAVRNRTLRD